MAVTTNKSLKTHGVNTPDKDNLRDTESFRKENSASVETLRLNEAQIFITGFTKRIT
jgi:hypothetical protein